MSLCPALIALGRLQARRGDPEADATLEEAWRVAIATGELQRIAPTVAGARAEHAWLDGRLERASWRCARSTYALADARRPAVGRAPRWRSGCAARASTCRRIPTTPSRYALRRRRRLARRRPRRGSAIGFVVRGGRTRSRRRATLEALTIYDQLGATRVAAFLRRELRAPTACAGSRAARGPRAATTPTA